MSEITELSSPSTSLYHTWPAHALLQASPNSWTNDFNPKILQHEAGPGPVVPALLCHAAQLVRDYLRLLDQKPHFTGSSEATFLPSCQWGRCSFFTDPRDAFNTANP